MDDRTPRLAETLDRMQASPGGVGWRAGPDTAHLAGLTRERPHHGMTATRLSTSFPTEVHQQEKGSH